MTAALAIPPAEAIGFLSFIIAWNGGVIPVYLNGNPTPEAYLPANDLGKRLAKRAAIWDMRDSAQVDIGLPEASRNSGGPAACTVLWCWTRSRDSARRASRFRPRPTMVLRLGASCQRLLLWGLRESVPHVSVGPANRKLSYALHAPQVTAEPGRLRVPLPATFLRVGRKRPAPILVTWMAVEASYAQSQVVATLRDPPPPFMQRLRNGEVKR